MRLSNTAPIATALLLCGAWSAAASNYQGAYTTLTPYQLPSSCNTPHPTTGMCSCPDNTTAVGPLAYFDNATVQFAALYVCVRPTMGADDGFTGVYMTDLQGNCAVRNPYSGATEACRCGTAGSTATTFPTISGTLAWCSEPVKALGKSGGWSAGACAPQSNDYRVAPSPSECKCPSRYTPELLITNGMFRSQQNYSFINALYHCSPDCAKAQNATACSAVSPVCTLCTSQDPYTVTYCVNRYTTQCGWATNGEAGTCQASSQQCNGWAWVGCCPLGTSCCTDMHSYQNCCPANYNICGECGGCCPPFATCQSTECVYPNEAMRRQSEAYLESLGAGRRMFYNRSANSVQRVPNSHRRH